MATDDNLRGTSAAARAAECAESTLRDLDRRGIVPALREAGGRRLWDQSRIDAVRAYLAQQRGRAA